MAVVDRGFQLVINAGCLVVMAFILCVVFILLASVHDSGSDVCVNGTLRFASYYGDHMVLQKSPERAVVWGYGPEGAQVTLFVTGPINHKPSAVTVTKGIWRVTLDPVDAGGPYNVTAAFQGCTATLTDVLFGDIWLCGGQSNMYFKTSQIFNASEELTLAAKYPHVRTFMAALNLSESELTDLIKVELPWSVPTASVVAEFSAVCWLFGRYMYEKLKYPIGLVQSCWGGTPVEAWSSSRALQRCGLEKYTDSPKVRNSVLWNAMIHPLLNMTIYGAIWYQGEQNADYHQDKYNCSFPAMIDDWRMAFHQGSEGQTAPLRMFPLYVQLSTYKKYSTDDGFPNIRWHQTADVGFVPNPRMKKTFMAVALDLPDETSPFGTIHPRDKQDVAYRLTLGARAVAYNEEGVHFLGPFPIQILVNNMDISVTYDQAISVTLSKDVFEVCCSDIKAVCGFKSRWVPAHILQTGLTSIQVFATLCQTSDEVAALRYAWKDWPCDFKACPVYSSSRVLPAPPFIINRYPEKEDVWKS
ncbi:sialate O-acetylesterase [Parambassis ranga]|uniref:Sialate O-acetylesterase n=1 Tax=Parambassis ranga TaxID=210632 RepID=A0A6P7JE48_9TELE|nr:sialate O-acetylesterase [Parambassis ranga]